MLKRFSISAVLVTMLIGLGVMVAMQQSADADTHTENGITTVINCDGTGKVTVNLPEGLTPPVNVFFNINDQVVDAWFGVTGNPWARNLTGLPAGPFRYSTVVVDHPRGERHVVAVAHGIHGCPTEPPTSPPPTEPTPTEPTPTEPTPTEPTPTEPTPTEPTPTEPTPTQPTSPPTSPSTTPPTPCCTPTSPPPTEVDAGLVGTETNHDDGAEGALIAYTVSLLALMGGLVTMIVVFRRRGSHE